MSFIRSFACCTYFTEMPYCNFCLFVVCYQCSPVESRKRYFLHRIFLHRIMDTNAPNYKWKHLVIHCNNCNASRNREITSPNTAECMYSYRDNASAMPNYLQISFHQAKEEKYTKYCKLSWTGEQRQRSQVLQKVQMGKKVYSKTMRLYRAKTLSSIDALLMCKMTFATFAARQTQAHSNFCSDEFHLWTGTLWKTRNCLDLFSK